MEQQQAQQLGQAGINVAAQKLGNLPTENLGESLQQLQEQIGQ